MPHTGTPTLDVTSASITAIGGRSANEDALGQTAARCGRCYVISDGAGGHFGGAVASRLVIDAVIAEVERAEAFSAAVLERAFAHAQARIAERQRREPTLATMSATVAALLIDGNGRRAVWGHLGDSRILHFRRGTLRTMTRDHSLVQRLVDAGYVAADRAAEHPGRNLLYGALGAEAETQPAVEREPVTLGDGDAFLLCTDGFWGRIDLLPLLHDERPGRPQPARHHHGGTRQSAKTRSFHRSTPLSLHKTQRSLDATRLAALRAGLLTVISAGDPTHTPTAV